MTFVSSSEVTSGGTAFTNLKIGTKIVIISACLLVILAALVVKAGLSFSAVGDDFHTYTQRVGVVEIAQNLDRGVLEMRGHAREYALLGHEEDETKARAQAASLEKLFEQGAATIHHPERQAKLRDAKTQFQVYLKGFDQIVAWKSEQVKLVAEVLDPNGQKATQGLEALAAQVDAAASVEGHKLALEGVATSLRARLYANKMLGRHEEAAARTAEENFTKLAGILKGLEAVGVDQPFLATVRDIGEAVARYHQGFRRAAELSGLLDRAVNGAMRHAGESVAADVAFIRDTGVTEENKVEAEVKAMIGSTQTLVLILGLIGAVIGIGLSVVIGRAISGPILKMTEAMRRLAGGDNTIQIPGVGRRDEVGAMAEALQAFKEAALAKLRLEEEERREMVKKAERQARVEDLTRRFDTAITGLLGQVSASAESLNSASNSLSATAEQTERQSATVSSAAEQATTNVQTVAAAGNELAASIQEIARQVTEGSSIATSAERDAGAANQRVLTLAEAIGKIGEVTKLISGIASQTNLLALNATIEAARAGEAGKGFAVVASEVKNLATQTAKATDEIAAQISAIQSETGATVDAIRGIVATIMRIREISTATSAAVEEQGAATSEIVRNVDEAAQGTRVVADNMIDVAKAAADTGQMAGAVFRTAGELRQLSDILKGEVESFLRGVQAA